MKHILVIDDDANIRMIFERFLAKQGYEVDCAEDGRVGLDLLEGKSPDLVITDIMMPKADGLEVVLSMRENHPDTPIVAISAGIATTAIDFLPVAEKITSGKVKILYKPVELADLLATIRELL